MRGSCDNRTIASFYLGTIREHPFAKNGLFDTSNVAMGYIYDSARIPHIYG